MKENHFKKPVSVYFLILLHILLGLGGIYGGGGLVADPTGGILKLPLYLIENTLFKDYLIPGIILLIILGIIPLIIAFGLSVKWKWEVPGKLNIFKGKHWSWSYSLYTGFALIIWITVQMFMIKEIAFIHIFYIFKGLLIQMVTLLPSVQTYYSDNPK